LKESRAARPGKFSAQVKQVFETYVSPTLIVKRRSAGDGKRHFVAGTAKLPRKANGRDIQTDGEGWVSSGTRLCAGLFAGKPYSHNWT